MIRKYDNNKQLEDIIAITGGVETATRGCDNSN